MTIEAVQKMLEEMGIWNRKYSLEAWNFWEELGPKGAFDEIACFTLTNPRHRRAFDASDRNWRPVFVTGNELLIDPSPEMFTLFLSKTRYFEWPGEFADDLVFQMHRFAFDFFEGYKVREKELDIKRGELFVSGYASRGVGSSAKRFAFETRAKPGQLSEFLPDEEESELAAS